ncbi:MAG: SUMF1/EgtB/PvdO family nonheme iron enzyme [Aestuariivirga sp.]|nr:SUMF1/EgtB/PvdO family nonheme iron enzyme [Aestuariivirga sp.]
MPFAPRAQRIRNAQATRAERLRRRKFRRNLFTFIVSQLVIAGVAFVGVRDYMSDGYLKHAVADIWKQVANAVPESKAEPGVTIAVQPPPVLDAAASEETAAVQQSSPETETALASALLEPEEQPDEQITSAAEPQSELQREVQAAPADVEPESAPQAEVAAAAEPEPEPEPQPQPTVPVAAPEPAPVAQQVAVAAVPVPDLTTLKNAPSVIEQPGFANSQQKEGMIFRDCDVCPELVSIAPGEFMVGPEGRGTAQQAITAVDAKKVVVDKPFAIGRYEITFDDWQHCVEGGGCKVSPADDGWGRGRHPVIHVSYNDISQQYLPWLSKVTGFTYRLPTEAEWELASQGGNKSSRGGITEVGSNVQLACSYGNSSDVAGKMRETIWAGAACNDGFLYTAPAGSLSPNSLGIYDMHGNVWEWVSDCWRATYDTEETANTETCKYHVLRGGSWASEFRFLPDGVWIGDAVAYRAAVRGWETSVKARNSIGFRVARSQP